MGRITIAVYRPIAGKEAELLELIDSHMPILKQEGLITDRKPYVMKAADGTIVEIFEWKSPAAIEAAHKNPQVAKLWERFGAVCEYLPPVKVTEFNNLFSEFEPIN